MTGEVRLREFAGSVGLHAPGRRAVANFRTALLSLALALTASTALPRGTSMDQLKQDLARRLSTSSAPMDSFFRSEGVSVEAIPTPFLDGAGIVKVVNRGPRIEKISFVGWSGADFALFLSGSPDAFARLVASARVNLSTDELRIAFVRTMLETTANLNFRFRLLSSSQEIPDRPGATSEETARVAGVRARYAKSVTGPTIQALNGGWRVTFHALIVQDLVRIDVDVKQDGSARIEKTILEKDLAMPYIMG